MMPVWFSARACQRTPIGERPINSDVIRTQTMANTLKVTRLPKSISLSLLQQGLFYCFLSVVASVILHKRVSLCLEQKKSFLLFLSGENEAQVTGTKNSICLISWFGTMSMDPTPARHSSESEVRINVSCLRSVYPASWNAHEYVHKISNPPLAKGSWYMYTIFHISKALLKRSRWNPTKEIIMGSIKGSFYAPLGYLKTRSSVNFFFIAW